MKVRVLILAVIFALALASSTDADRTTIEKSRHTRAEKRWIMDVPEAEREPEIDAEQEEMLACAIYMEAGGDACSDLCRFYVGDVILNRVNDPRFPDTLEGVLTAELQYGRFHWTGIVWPERAQNPGEVHAVERAYRIARALLSGEHSELYGAGYIYQAESEQGTDVIYLDGLYFGR